MPLMSVYRQKQPAKRYADADCFAACGNADDLQLIKLSIRTGQPVLVGLEGESTILKPVSEGDETQSFEALVDTCYTPTDLRRMKDAGVDDPTKVPPGTYRLETRFEVALEVAVTIALTASSNGEALPRLRQLLDDDVMFRASVHEEILKIIAAYLVSQAELPVRVRESTSTTYEPLDPPLDPNGPGWRILESDD